MSDELGTVIEPDEPRRAPLGGELVEQGDDGVSVDGAIHDDRRALAGVLVDDLEQLDGAASTVTSNWKSIAHTAFGRIGHIAPTWEPGPVRRFLRRL